jgi:hypothetical protein
LKDFTESIIKRQEERRNLIDSIGPQLLNQETIWTPLKVEEPFIEVQAEEVPSKREREESDEEDDLEPKRFKQEEEAVVEEATSVTVEESAAIEEIPEVKSEKPHVFVEPNPIIKALKEDSPNSTPVRRVSLRDFIMQKKQGSANSQPENDEKDDSASSTKVMEPIPHRFDTLKGDLKPVAPEVSAHSDLSKALESTQLQKFPQDIDTTFSSAAVQEYLNRSDASNSMARTRSAPIGSSQNTPTGLGLSRPHSTFDMEDVQNRTGSPSPSLDILRTRSVDFSPDPRLRHSAESSPMESGQRRLTPSPSIEKQRDFSGQSKVLPETNAEFKASDNAQYGSGSAPLSAGSRPPGQYEYSSRAYPPPRDYHRETRGAPLEEGAYPVRHEERDYRRDRIDNSRFRGYPPRGPPRNPRDNDLDLPHRERSPPRRRPTFPDADYPPREMDGEGSDYYRSAPRHLALHDRYGYLLLRLGPEDRGFSRERPVDQDFIDRRDRDRLPPSLGPDDRRERDRPYSDREYRPHPYGRGMPYPPRGSYRGRGKGRGNLYHRE